ncbi:MAG: hypothetical protein KKF54_00850 [Candidatus Omnitrophica bacterium]|nr:hypothetical protein [Candidatus Omnitrophota bacterium]
MLKLSERNLKIITILIVLLFLDLLKPFNYFIYVEFLILGIILLAFNYPFFLAILISVVFGYVKDTLSHSNIPLNLIEFPVIVIFIHYFIYRFNKKIIRLIICLIAIIGHICFNGLMIGEFNFIVSLGFFTQAAPIYFLINYLSKKWVKSLSVEYI